MKDHSSMKFLVDECTGQALALWLRKNGYDVLSVYDDMRGAKDDEVLKRAFDEDRILVTNDKNFGEMVMRQQKLHRGTILLRLSDERSFNKIATFKWLLENHFSVMFGNFFVVTENSVRIVKVKLV
jgi:predicted nuclease of predicted toxin-antitoxin system